MESSGFDYKKYVQMIHKYKIAFISVALGLMTIVVLFSFSLPRIYEARSTFLIEKSKIDELVSGIALSQSVDSEIKFLKSTMTSRSLMAKVLEDLKVKPRNDDTIDFFISGTKIDSGAEPDKGLFSLTYRSTDPNFASRYVNALVKAYVEENFSNQRAESSRASSFLSDELKRHREQLDKADTELNQYKTSKAELVNTDEAVLLGEIGELRERRETLRVKRSQLEALRAMNISQNPLKDRLNTLRKTLGELQALYTDSYPEVQRLKEEIATINSQLRSGKREALPVGDLKELGRVEVELKGVRAEEASVSNLLASKQRLFDTIAPAKSRLLVLQKERDNRDAIYQDLATRHKRSQFTSEMSLSDRGMNFRIVDPAVVPRKPVSPDRVRIILLGILAGLVGGFGVAFLLDRYDNSIRSVGTLKTLGFPVLAVIPRIENEEELLLKKKSDLRLYGAAGCYFSLILIVLLMEKLRLPLLDSLLENMDGNYMMSAIKGLFGGVF